MKIDYNRGVLKKVVPQSGVNVYMYKDEPGVYRNKFGTVVADTLAIAAGFDVDYYGKLKTKKEKMAVALAAIEKELELAGEAREIVAEKSGWKVIGIGLDRYMVEDPDGTVVNDNPLSRIQADRLIGELVPDEAE